MLRREGKMKKVLFVIMLIGAISIGVFIGVYVVGHDKSNDTDTSETQQAKNLIPWDTLTYQAKVDLIVNRALADDGTRGGTSAEWLHKVTSQGSGGFVNIQAERNKNGFLNIHENGRPKNKSGLVLEGNALEIRRGDIIDFNMKNKSGEIIRHSGIVVDAGPNTFEHRNITIISSDFNGDGMVRQTSINTMDFVNAFFISYRIYPYTRRTPF